MDIFAALERAAKDLPASYTIYLAVENGAAWVELRKGFIESESIDFDTTDMNLDDQIYKAIELAIEHSKKGVITDAV